MSIEILFYTEPICNLGNFFKFFLTISDKKVHANYTLN
jgi:hypothetical protein